MGRGENAGPVIAVTAQIGAVIGAIIGAVLSLVFGILMLVPASPFSHREIGWGVTLIVCTVILPVTSVIGALAGACVTSTICGPVVCCCAACCSV